MTEATIIGLDLAKNVFQAHGARADGSVAFRIKLVRTKVLAFFAAQPACTVAIVLIDFWAQWCGPCRSLAPVVDELAARHPALTVVKVDVEANGNLADEFDVRSVPSLLLFKAGQCVGRQVGKVWSADRSCLRGTCSPLWHRCAW